MTLAATQLSFAYRAGAPVLNAVSAEFSASCFTAIIGPNGAGKSTLLRLLLGVLTPAGGSVTLGGKPLASLSRHQRAASLAYVPQRSDVAFPFSVRAVVAMGRYAADAAETDGAVQRALSAVDLLDRADEPLGTLSAGQQQRATLARALAQFNLPPSGIAKPPHSPRFLLLDEPATAMDPAHALHAMGLLRSLSDTGPGVIAVLHDLALVARYADRVLVLSGNGSVAAHGPAKDVLSPQVLSPVFSVNFRAIPGQAAGAAPILLPTE